MKIVVTDDVRVLQRATSNDIGIAMTKWDEFIDYNEQDLRDLGVLSSESDFVIQQGMNGLLGGAIWQQHTKHMSLVERVDGLEVELIAAKEELAALAA